MDFAKNYPCKYAKETQVIHFGENREHVSLHTGVLYTGDVVKLFCRLYHQLDTNSVLREYSAQNLENTTQYVLHTRNFPVDSEVVQFQSNATHLISHDIGNSSCVDQF